MLLVEDGFRRLRSLRPQAAAGPFVPDTRYDGIERAREFLARFDRDDALFKAALSAEAGGDEVANLDAQALIDAAAPAIATGLIAVARPMPKRWSVAFDRHRPTAPALDVVGFPGRAAAAGVAVAIQSHRRFAAALQDALHDEAGERGLTAVAPLSVWRHLLRPRGQRSSVPLPDIVLTTAQIARLLADSWLLLVPGTPETARFRLAWRRHSSGGTEDTDDGDAGEVVSRRPPPRPEPDGPRSVLPAAPRSVSPQAAALIAAALSGAPFAESCPAANSGAGIV